MNKRGQTFFLALVYAAALFMFGMLFLGFLKLDVSTARTALDCSNTNGISDGTKLTCLGVDWVVPYFIIIIVSGAGGWVLSRLNI